MAAKPTLALLLAAFVFTACGGAAPNVGLSYPEAMRGDVVDDYHGVKVPDPYRWLEDADSPQTRAWITAQNALTFGWLDAIPERARIRARLEAQWDYERYGVPIKKGERYFFSKNDGLQNQSVFYVTDALDAEPRVLLDPNTLSDDGTVAVRGYYTSKDGSKLAYGLSTSGSDWTEFKVRDVATGKDLEDHIEWAKFTAASWMPDGSGFYYARYDEPTEDDKLTKQNYFHKVYFHRLGTPQSDDVLIYENADEKEWGFYASPTDDQQYLVIYVWQGTDPKNRIYYRRLEGGIGDTGEVVRLLDDFDASYELIGTEGTRFWFKTDLDAPRGKVIEIDIAKPERTNWRTLIPQGGDTLEDVNLVGDRFVCRWLQDAKSRVTLHALDGSLEKVVDLPGIGSVGGFGGRREHTESFFSFTSYTSPGAVYRYDFTSGETTLFRRPAVDLDPDDYVVEQVFYASSDGTRIPMFIAHKKGLKRDGSNPTYLYGYGGFNVSLTPYYSPAIRVWMDMGGIFAVPNIRGGGEYGEDWHRAGTKERKQNVFNDFIGAAEWLIAERYTSPPKLAIAGGSNGGLLVGACITQRPELFGAALPAVGVMDMLRFHKFTIGWAWASDYGTADDPKLFPVLHAYSPLHNIKPGTRYPATFVTTADHDDRVVPAHSFKFTAALQHAQGGAAPVLIRIDTKAGHGAGKPTKKVIDESADKWSFLYRILGMKLPSGF